MNTRPGRIKPPKNKAKDFPCTASLFRYAIKPNPATRATDNARNTSGLVKNTSPVNKPRKPRLFGLGLFRYFLNCKRARKLSKTRATVHKNKHTQNYNCRPVCIGRKQKSAGRSGRPDKWWGHLINLQATGKE